MPFSAIASLKKQTKTSPGTKAHSESCKWIRCGNCVKRVSADIPPRRPAVRGSLTVEAAVTLPVFLIMMCCLLYPLLMLCDYMYIQQMRFGSRIAYDCRLEVDEEETIIPAFTLQPIVENAIIHGLSKKEQGGKILLKIWKEGNKVIISVADTGVGMSQESLLKLRGALKAGGTARVGIGLGNICRRIHAMYKNGDFRIYSSQGNGTVVQVTVPQDEHVEMDNRNQETT